MQRSVLFSPFFFLLGLFVGLPCHRDNHIPKNGSIGTCFNYLQHNSSCSITCDVGFHKSYPEQTCHGGHLDHLEPQRCLESAKIPCPFFVPDHGELGTCPASLSLNHSSKCMFACKSGFALTPNISVDCLYGDLSTVPVCAGTP
jgi:hypothetical protein